MRTALFTLLVLPLTTFAGPSLPGEVRAVLQQHCVECHGGKAKKAGLDLSTPEGIARGGRKGAVVVPRQLGVSKLWQMVQADRMPPDAPLAEGPRKALRSWIEAGAPGIDLQGGAGHWAFRVPVRPAVPGVAQPERAQTAIDRFLLATLAQKKLSFAAEADRATLVRRVAFDLTGLPPSVERVDQFLSDNAPDAYERMVERFLASPHYGERWGKYWLDAAGYADSNGYFSADSDRPLAWRYRDWVVRALNADMPYDRFVQEQLAGDELCGYSPSGEVTPAMVGPLTATHFLRNAPDGTGESDGNPDEVRIDRYTVLEGNLQIVMNCLLGLTIQCARCHEHKFEPIAHDEYYGLQAILIPAYLPQRWSKPAERVAVLAPKSVREEHAKRSAEVERQIKGLQGELAKAKGAEHERIKAEIARKEKDRPRPLETLAVLADVTATPPVHHLLVRGRHESPGREVQPGVPAALCNSGNAYYPGPFAPPATTSGRRTALAHWVTSPDNPLVARVMVNRIWQRHFGTGLVATPDNLGQSGARPSHPELLDWLAVELVEHGWSIKHLHRLILSSAAYRQSSAPRPEAVAVDPDNRLLGRFPLRRLDAEALRDAMLAVSGELDVTRGGPYVPTTRTGEGTVVVDENRPGARRRSVYLQQRRTQVATLLELFDAPSIAITCSARNTSTVPLQALALVNSDFSRKRALAFARRVSVIDQPDGRIALAFRMACGREPEGLERSAARRFLVEQRAVYAAHKDAEARTWVDLCQMVLASNAFLYVE